jgi:TolA-binding protein
MRLAMRCLLPGLMIGLAVPVVMPAIARADTPSPESTEARLRRIEGELRAVQRKVFPDGAGKVFAPEIAPGDPAAPTPAPTGNTSALGDLLSRMDAVEAQLKALTAANEDGQHRLAQMDTRISAIEAAQAASATAAASAPPPIADDAPAKPAKGAPKAAGRGPDTPPPPSSPGAAERAAAVAAIVRPSTDDKAEDAYTYAYRLWEAKFLPEAEAVLLDFVQTYPKHKRISYARNLLGRAYLDDNRLRSAEPVFLQNYLADKTADRAPDSLLYLGIALSRDKLVKRACDVLAQFHQDYPAEAEGRLKGQYEAVTKTVACH